MTNANGPTTSIPTCTDKTWVKSVKKRLEEMEKRMTEGKKPESVNVNPGMGGVSDE